MLFSIKDTENDVTRLKKLIIEGGQKNESSSLSVIYSALSKTFPEAIFKENQGYIDFQRKTSTNLTIFTITIKQDKLSFTFNDCIKSYQSDNTTQPDDEILGTVQKMIMNLNYYMIIEFYEEHENLRWKHEIYKIDAFKENHLINLLHTTMGNWGKRKTVVAKAIKFIVGIIMVLHE